MFIVASLTVHILVWADVWAEGVDDVVDINADVVKVGTDVLKFTAFSDVGTFSDVQHH